LIVVESGGAVLRDLGSRNGVRVNGVRVTGEVVLARGDRIRIGNQDLVFGSERRGSSAETTHDVVMETGEIDARLTPIQSPHSTSWWLDGQTRLLDEAIASGDINEAEAILIGMENGMRERLLSGEHYERSVIEAALRAVLDLAMKQQEPRWVELVFDVLRDFRVLPGPVLAAKIEALPAELVEPRRSGRRLRGAREKVPQVS